ncbi:xanthine dehydrogenase family protein subunit M [Nocardioides carbamazepini]|uniref:FAD binding domain-containing protein n=1 Tax=Nocardioides carbamazepini TaxID=2854259 RepID=UPI00214A3BD2|nr:xanthine dehydrogenase family protein subunit M [Nocardioides carbamazepini]MCR1784792.1 xanthine dehydrogenase family protein subunit M [Nocardioides carbamazepini]
MSDVLTTMAYERARSVPEALVLLAEGGEDARPISGGQSLVPMMNLGLAAPAFLVDVSAVPGLRTIAVEGEHLVIGAAVTHAELTSDPLVAEHAPLLARAARQIGSQRIRNRGTIGGSVAHGDAAAELPVSCHVLEADYRIESATGTELRAAGPFSLGYYQTDLAPGELVTAIRVPLRPRHGWGFQEYSRRAGDFALASAAAGVRLEGDRIAEVAIAVTGAADRPVRLGELERSLTGQSVASAVRSVAGLAAELTVADDPYCAGADRARLIEVMVERAVRDACADVRKDRP